MRLLLIASQLGFSSSGFLIPGGLQQFARCLVRALSSYTNITKLGIWSQVDDSSTENFIQKMVEIYAHKELKLDIRGYGGNRTKLAFDSTMTNWSKSYDHVMYLLVNQSVLSLIPFSLPYTVWEIGEELFQPLGFFKYQALKRASNLMSISENTNQSALNNNSGIQSASVIHLCVEPPLYELEEDKNIEVEYYPSSRKPVVLIVGSMNLRTLYKGHKELIEAWPEIICKCPNAELWIVGDGEGKQLLQNQSMKLPNNTSRKILFKGSVDDKELQECYRSCRIFAMPSIGEGFGLVFVEAAKNGLPSIGGKHDSVKEIVIDGETGILVEQNAHEIALACLRLLLDDDEAKRMGDNARNRYFTYYRFQNFEKRLHQKMRF